MFPFGCIVDFVNRRQFIAAGGAGGALLQRRAAAAHSTEILPGVWKFSFGTPEQITPVSTRHYPPSTQGFDQLPTVAACPVAVTANISQRGCLVAIPLAPNEAPY